MSQSRLTKWLHGIGYVASVIVTLEIMAGLFLAYGGSKRGARSLEERLASTRTVEDCLNRNAPNVSGPAMSDRVALLHGLCRQEEAADLATWIKWAGNRPSILRATETSQEKWAEEALLDANRRHLK
jgi:hypothetical protein